MTLAAILAPEDTVLQAMEAAFFAEAQPWGFILFARNIETKDQLRRLTGDLRDAVGRDAPILIDQEGGRVQRMRGPIWREFPPALDQAGLGTRAFWLRGRLIAEDLREVGIDVNCAPLADVARDATHPVVKNRCYGFDPGTVAENARAMAGGLLSGGVLPVLKHLPGYGLGTVDSHLALPRVTAPRAVLEAVDFAAFRPLGDIRLGMTAHVVMEAVEDGLPATMSPTMVQVIRQELGFQGLLMSDDISMEALPGALGTRVTAMQAAGCEIALHCNGKLSEMEEVAGASRALDGLALTRAEAALAERRVPDPLDIDALQAESDGLVMDQVNERDAPTAGKQQ